MAKEGQEKKNENTRRPKAKKRDLQNERRRLQNRSFKSTVRSAIRKYEEALTSGSDKKSQQEALDQVYSYVDRAVKHNIFKPNKANRTKSRLASKIATA